MYSEAIINLMEDETIFQMLHGLEQQNSAFSFRSRLKPMYNLWKEH